MKDITLWVVSISLSLLVFIIIILYIQNDTLSTRLILSSNHIQELYKLLNDCQQGK